MRATFEAAYRAEVEARGLPFDATVFARQADGDYVISTVQAAWWGFQASRPVEDARAAFEAAVIARMKESGFLEVEIRVEMLGRNGAGYSDASVDSYWHYWQSAWAMHAPVAAPAAAPKPHSYHDLHITTDQLARTSIMSLPFDLVVTCSRTGGWELWRLGGIRAQDEKLASEFSNAGKGLCLDVDGHVIVNSRSSTGAAE